MNQNTSASLAREIRLGLQHRWRFLNRYLQEPHVVGALFPSSQALAEALCRPLQVAQGPMRILEVGAGTGAITRHLGTILGPQKELDVCELQPEFAEILERDVLGSPVFVPAVQQGRVRLLCTPVQELSEEGRYDFIICCLPLTAFQLKDVQDVFQVIRRSLKPSGVLSYFEYIALRKASRWLAVGRHRARLREVSAYLNEIIRRHQFARKIVYRNLPPACARYLSFNDAVA